MPRSNATLEPIASSDGDKFLLILVVAIVVCVVTPALYVAATAVQGLFVSVP
ncbi:MAG TPA: hypothetical protein VN932_08345 [Rhizomicrobium sp.]|jgi:hypothetical protein|nr:hypothetical protein [Rhizomicrobium sp.]